MITHRLHTGIQKAFTSIKHLVSELVFEHRYGVRTSGNLILERHDAENICNAPMNWRQLRWALPANSVTKQDIFLDIDSGKGRAVLMAAIDYPFARVIGVELIKELHEIAERNLVAAGARSARSSLGAEGELAIRDNLRVRVLRRSRRRISSSI